MKGKKKENKNKKQNRVIDFAGYKKVGERENVRAPFFCNPRQYTLRI